MNRKLFLMIFSAILCTLLTFVGCAPTIEEQTPTVAKAVISGSELYTQAVADLMVSENFGVSVTVRKTIETKYQAISEKITSEYVYENLNSSEPQIAVTESITYPSGTLAVSKNFENNTSYIKLDGSYFSAASTYTAFTEDLIPTDLLTPTLYKKISTEEKSDHILVSFSDPRVFEDWVFPKVVQFINAFGSARFTMDGALTQCDYTAQCIAGKTKITLYVAVAPFEATKTIDFSPSENEYVSVSDIAIPLTLEKCSKFLTGVKNIYSQMQSKIISQASGLERTQNTEVSHTFSGNEYQATVKNEVTLSDSTRSDSVSTTNQIENFSNGQYTTQINGTTVANSEITDAIMQDYCQSLLVGTIPLPTHINKNGIISSDDKLIYIFTAKDELAELVRTNTCQTLYQDPNALDAVASDYKTTDISGSLTIDRLTGFPISCTVSYEGLYTIEGIGYTLSCDVFQNYTFSE